MKFPDLTYDIKEKLNSVLKKHRLKFIILHGSYAKGTAHKESDVDIALFAGRLVDAPKIFDIYGEIDEVLRGLNLGELDIKFIDRADPLFRYLVVRSSILLAGNESDYNEFKAYAFRDYLDSADLRMLERKMIDYKIKELSKHYTHAR